MNGIRLVQGIRSLLVLSAIGGAASLLGSCQRTEKIVYSPECPDHHVSLPDSGGGTIHTVPLAGAITDIAEFHDCQRMILPGKPQQYGPLIGIWVSQYLEKLPDSLAHLNLGLLQLMPISPLSDTVLNAVRPGVDTLTGSVPQRPAIAGTGLAFAEIYSWDGNYDPLGIKQGWNCLYVFPGAQPPGYGAIMVPVRDPNTCLLTALADTLYNRAGTKALYAFEEHYPGLGMGDYPPVGRWDWDRTNQVQYIGLGCGDRWCEVTDQLHHVPSSSWDPGPGGDQRVWRVKGWFDQQQLAVQPAGGSLEPAPFMGTVVPDRTLDHMTDVTDFHRSGPDPFVHVARAALTASSGVYLTKLNLVAATFPAGSKPHGWANIYLCTGSTEKDCFPQGGAPTTCDFSKSDGMWWARIETPDTMVYRCVTHVDHSGAIGYIPGTARWRWVNNDEKLWLACAAGCCQLQ